MTTKSMFLSRDAALPDAEEIIHAFVRARPIYSIVEVESVVDDGLYHSGHE